MRIGLGGIIVGAVGLYLVQRFTGALIPGGTAKKATG